MINNSFLYAGNLLNAFISSPGTGIMLNSKRKAILIKRYIIKEWNSNNELNSNNGPSFENRVYWKFDIKNDPLIAIMYLFKPWIGVKYFNLQLMVLVKSSSNIWSQQLLNLCLFHLSFHTIPILTFVPLKIIMLLIWCHFLRLSSKLLPYQLSFTGRGELVCTSVCIPFFAERILFTPYWRIIKVKHIIGKGKKRSIISLYYSYYQYLFSPLFLFL